MNRLINVNHKLYILLFILFVDSVTLTNAVHPIVIGYWSSDQRVKRTMVNRQGDKRGMVHNLWKTKKVQHDRDAEGCILNAEQKPVQLFQQLIETFSYPKQWILDSHCGTGL